MATAWAAAFSFEAAIAALTHRLAKHIIPPLLHSLAFGGVLPLVSILFARILANPVEDESQVNSDLTGAKETIKLLRAQLAEVEEHLAQAGPVAPILTSCPQ